MDFNCTIGIDLDFGLLSGNHHYNQMNYISHLLLIISLFLSLLFKDLGAATQLPLNLWIMLIILLWLSGIVDYYKACLTAGTWFLLLPWLDSPTILITSDTDIFQPWVEPDHFVEKSMIYYRRARWSLASNHHIRPIETTISKAKRLMGTRLLFSSLHQSQSVYDHVPGYPTKEWKLLCDLSTTSLSFLQKNSIFTWNSHSM